MSSVEVLDDDVLECGALGLKRRQAADLSDMVNLGFEGLAEVSHDDVP